MQEVCLRLMGKKLLVALAMEGKFASEGLQAIDGDDDMLTAMARELVENKGIGESADSIWRNVQQLRPSTASPAHKELLEDRQFEHVDVEMPTVLPSTPNLTPDAGILESASMLRGSSRKSIEPAQLSLF